MSDGHPRVIFGNPQRDHVEIQFIYRHDAPQKAALGDRNLVHARVIAWAVADDLRLQFMAEMGMDDLDQFVARLQEARKDLTGAATFKSQDDRVAIVVRGDGIGGFDVGCVLDEREDRALKTLDGTDERPRLNIHLRHGEVDPILERLSEILAEYPPVSAS
jgi:hypothetical protein